MICRISTYDIFDAPRLEFYSGLKPFNFRVKPYSSTAFYHVYVEFLSKFIVLSGTQSTLDILHRRSAVQSLESRPGPDLR